MPRLTWLEAPSMVGGSLLRRSVRRLCRRRVGGDAVGVSESPIELSVQASPTDQRSWVGLARRCESVGCRALLVGDHPGSGPSPFVALAAAASVTSTLRLGSYVINAGVRDPLLLAGDVATLDVVSDGRAELGIGAGHTPAEWAMTGRTRPPPAGRIEHLIWMTTVVGDLLAGRSVPADAAGGLIDAQLTGPRPVQHPVPVLVGGANPALLRWGGGHAEAVGLSGLGRTLADGHTHTVSWSAAQLDTQVGLVRHAAAQAGMRTPALEALVQHVEITDDPTSSCTTVRGEARARGRRRAGRALYADRQCRSDHRAAAHRPRTLGHHPAGRAGRRTRRSRADPRSAPALVFPADS
jgi:alkanesulfonate monooxygenase SsuD/methylene tetrahydromethanopterin reductase-like flavin-dependent oxidoreductase (luciferase family)